MTPTLDVLDFRNGGFGHDGEGLVILPGPPTLSRYRGILSTLHFENLRDGLEDYECYVLLGRLLAAANARSIDVAEETQGLKVPPLVVDFPPPSVYPQTPRYFTEDPVVV